MTTTDRSGAVFAGSRTGDVDAPADVFSDPRRRLPVVCRDECAGPLAAAETADERGNRRRDASRDRIAALTALREAA